MDEIEMHMAFVWDCDGCGAENFTRPIIPGLHPEEEKQMKEDLGIEPWKHGQLVQCPKVVECTKCGAKYKTMEE